MTRAEKKAAKELDAEIDKIYRENCANVQVDLFDIPKIFAEGRKAKAEGRDLKKAIVTFVQSIREN